MIERELLQEIGFERRDYDSSPSAFDICQERWVLKRKSSLLDGSVAVGYGEYVGPPYLHGEEITIAELVKHILAEADSVLSGS